MKNCELCNREQELTFHHLIPKKNHKIKHIRERYTFLNIDTYGIKICRDCHKMAHKLIPHKSLAFDYNTKEKLLKHTDLKNFIDWVKYQTKKVK
tara:strand:+ start:106 stop:387 length:282 start_codon:yes stop_codon:yes gene_type:complete